jgi:hypothetical protein
MMADPMAPRRAYTDAEIEAAVQTLSDPERLRAAETLVSRTAPQLQGILDAALQDADWFGSAHRSEVLKAAGAADPEERYRAVLRLIEEETRVSMLIGVAVGLELAAVLNEQED